MVHYIQGYSSAGRAAVSKTACREFESFCPCQENTRFRMKSGVFRHFLGPIIAARGYLMLWRSCKGASIVPSGDVCLERFRLLQHQKSINYGKDIRLQKMCKGIIMNVRYDLKGVDKQKNMIPTF